jgi:predicted DNA-binding protein (UPF0251 family)/predicted Fe-Mo cluster-binding NifX family protein
MEIGMPRPCATRRIGQGPHSCRFGPQGEGDARAEIALGFDEFEALRLSDYEGLYQEAAARRMGVSRQTYGRILESARRKLSKALVEGAQIRIEGGAVRVAKQEEEEAMKMIAVPTRDRQVDSHFGHCDHYTIYGVEGGAIVSETTMAAGQGCGCKSGIGAILAREGVSLLIAGNMGQGALNALRASGIEVLRGASGPARAAVEAYLAGKLADSGIGCASHEAHHECGH